MEENTNIVKKVCAELGITQKELAEIMGVNDGTPAQWSSKGKMPEMAQNFMNCLLENKELKSKLDIFKQAHKIASEL